ncbi:hypothetical protein [Pseudoxanthomonas mexicana]|uniref:hypothetical protein n=1 Tax=Pseudoxanthomonas mexicana TaxID=128785 RepID=UPI000785C867|nr:hypothetical protein [Pseudoxanthomonas mexicana]
MNHPAPSHPLHTPDGRYIIIGQRLWRATKPVLAMPVRQRLTDALMQARRAVKAAQRSGDSSALASARAGVQAAKVALGERGPVWWTDVAKDYNRYLVKNTPYAFWFEQLP